MTGSSAIRRKEHVQRSGSPGLTEPGGSRRSRWPLLIATWPMIRYGREQASGILTGAGIGGLALVVIQGFAIGLGGWNWSILADLLGTEGPSQAGMGLGAGLVSTAFLMLLCQGLAGRGWCRGDAFIVSAIGVVVALTVISSCSRS